MELLIEKSNTGFCHKYEDIFNKYPVELNLFIRNLDLEFKDHKIGGAVYKDNKLILLFLNTYPFNLQLFTLDRNMSDLSEATSLVLKYFKKNNIRINGINTPEIIKDIIIDIAKENDFNIKLKIAMDIMKLGHLKINHDVKYMIADESYKEKIVDIERNFYKEAMFLDETDEYFNKLADKFINDKVFYMLLDEHDEIITCVVSRKINDFYNLSFVYTNKAYRNKGYSKKILSTIIHELLKEVSYITLFVDKINPISNRLYKDLGFEITVAMYDYALI